MMPNGAGRPVGELALAGGRVGAQFRYHHHEAERDLRGVARSDARSARAFCLASVARGGAGGRAAAQIAARPLSGQIFPHFPHQDRGEWGK